MPLFRRFSPNAVVAAATQINVNDDKQARQFRRHRSNLQTEAFDRYDQVGEIKFATKWFGAQVSKLRLFPAIFEDPTREPVPLTTDSPFYDRAWKALERLQMPHGTHAPLLGDWAINWLITGEAFLLALRRGTLDEEWAIKSVEEIEPSGTGGWRLKEDVQTGEPRIIGPQDFLVRLWIRHPRESSRADSPIMGILDPAEEILLLSRTVRAISRSRLHAGILKVPSELSFGALDPSQDADPTRDPFITALYEGLSAPIKDEGTSAQLVPIVIKGPAEYLESLKHEPLERPFDQEIDKLRERAIRRLAQGLPLPPEIILGMGDLAHWGVWGVSEQAFTQHIEPFVDGMMDSLTSGYFWPAMGIKAPGPGVPVLWYDHSRLIERPDRSADFKDAHERGAISDQAYREGMGFPETFAPSEDELTRRLLFQRSNVDPIITEMLLKMFVDEDIQSRISGEVGKGGIPARPISNEGKPSVPKESAPVKPSKSHTVPSDQALSSSAHSERLIGAFDAACRRALEKAGARIRTKTQKDKEITTIIAAAPNHRVSLVLGKEKVSRLGISDTKLIEGSFSDLKDQFFTWGESWGARQENVHASWTKASSQLSTLCKRSLFDTPEDIESVIASIAEEAMLKLGVST